MSCKETKHLVRRLKKAGFTVEHTGGSHIKVTAPTGGRYVLASTPSDTRSMKNNIAALRRIGFDTRAH